MILNKNYIHKINLKDKILIFKDEIINECINQKFKRDISVAFNVGFNFELDSQYKDYIYSIFIKECELKLNKFTLKDNNFKLWCYFTDDNFSTGNKVWHNHINTASINGVLYMKTQENSGLEFESTYVEPDDFDLLIFPGHLNHRPIISNKKTRIVLNLELRCIESNYDIFNICPNK